MMDTVLELRGVGHWFGLKKVLHDVNLKVIRGEIVSLVGPSGCGKSTLLRAILGTHPPRTGDVLMNGIPVRSPGRDRGIVYQRYSLYPFLTAQQNVALGLMFDQTSLHFRLFRFFQWKKIEKTFLARAAELLVRLGLGEALGHYPAELSGGMCQRVAIAQALIMRPEILLLDEPFGALDEATREDLQAMLLELYQENLKAIEEKQPPPHTILIVTHELNEALYVGDRVVGLSQHWRWEDTGLAGPPGATIIYDSVAPDYAPGEEREIGAFLEQRRELRVAVYEPAEREDPGRYLRFWREVEEGKGEGVLSIQGRSSSRIEGPG